MERVTILFILLLLVSGALAVQWQTKTYNVRETGVKSQGSSAISVNVNTETTPLKQTIKLTNSQPKPKSSVSLIIFLLALSIIWVEMVRANVVGIEQLSILKTCTFYLVCSGVIGVAWMIGGILTVSKTPLAVLSLLVFITVSISVAFVLEIENLRSAFSDLLFWVPVSLFWIGCLAEIPLVLIMFIDDVFLDLGITLSIQKFMWGESMGNVYLTLGSMFFLHVLIQREDKAQAPVNRQYSNNSNSIGCLYDRTSDHDSGGNDSNSCDGGCAGGFSGD
ncbi:hypothetical protein [Methyloglobulus sp.]|uniref:hypothetical protein n=1 Tax=Methyloglobulus sp. TaxID=2518622 RepID=UPI0032B8655E